MVEPETLSRASLDPSPRKEDSTGLIVRMVLDEYDEDALGHQATAVEVRTASNASTFEWDTNALGVIPPVKGGLAPRNARRGGLPAFALAGATLGARVQFQFNVWFPGQRYSVRWFQIEFALRDLCIDDACKSDTYVNASYSGPGGMRRNSGNIGTPWRMDQEGGDDMESIRRHEFSVAVLRNRGRLKITYAGYQHYHATEGVVVHVLIDKITLQLNDASVFKRFLTYRGHRITCSLGNSYLYRANKIRDVLPVKTVPNTPAYIETSRQRSGAPDSTDSGSANTAPGNVVQSSRRTYTWMARKKSDAAFPSVRDGHKPAGAEELYDLVTIKSAVGLSCAPGKDDDDESGSMLKKSASVQARLSASSSYHKTYVADSPDYANTRFRLPYEFTYADGVFRVAFYDFRVVPPNYVKVEIPWMDLDQEIVQTLPPSQRIPGASEEEEQQQKTTTPRLKKKLSLKGFSRPRKKSMENRGSWRAKKSPKRRPGVITPQLERRRSSPDIPALSLLLSPRLRQQQAAEAARLLAEAEEAEARRIAASKTGTIEKWITQDVKLTVRYRARGISSTSVDIEYVSLDILDFDSTLVSPELWKNGYAADRTV